MSIDLILALTLFLGATWLGLLKSIIAITRERPATRSLMIIAFMHFVVLVYSFLAASVLYGRTVKTVAGREWSRTVGYEEILVITWPAALLSALIGYLATRLMGLINPFVMAIPFFVIAILLLRWAKKTSHLSFLIAIPVLFFPYLFAMSLVWSGVSVSTDKQVYKPGDSVMITVRSEGYLFNPSINQIAILAGSSPVQQIPSNLSTGYVRITQTVSTDIEAEPLATQPTYIQVVYTPQAWWFSREEYAEITIVR